MASDNQISFEVTLDEKSIRDAYSKLEKQSQESGNKAADNFGNNFKDSTTRIFGGLKSQIAQLAAGLLAGFTLKKAIEESLEAEKALKQFSIALANAGKFSQDAVSSFTQYAQSLEQVTAVDADLITKNAALLVSLGNLSGQGLQKATKASLDLAAGLGMDVESAFTLVSKAASGSASALSRYGIRVDETLPKSQQFASALDQIQRKFGGLAEANTRGFGGALKLLTVNFNNFLESFGNLIKDSPLINQIIRDISNAFKSFAEIIGSFKGKNPFDTLILGLIDLARIFTGVIFPLIETFTRSFVNGLLTIQLGLNALSVLISGFASLLVNAFVAPIQTIANGYAELIGLVDGELGNKLKNSIAGLAQSATQPFNEEFEKTKERTASTFEALAASAEDNFNNKISSSLDTFVSDYQTKMLLVSTENQKLQTDFQNTATNVQSQVLTIGQGFQSFSRGFSSALTDFRNNSVKNFADIGRAAFQSLGTGIGNAFASFGKALVEGKNAFEAFGKAFIGILGGVLVQLGTGYILQGIAASANPLTPGAGGPLIAAGAALATFGGVLQALGGGGGGAAAGGGGVASGETGGGFGGGSSTEITGPEDLQPQGPTTAINVNVQGNILDRRQSGLEIAEVLQEAFSNQGISIGAAV